MQLTVALKQMAIAVINDLYGVLLPETSITITETKPDFEGDYTIVLFGLLKQLRQSPDGLGMAMGQALQAAHPDMVVGFTVVKGFLNLTISDAYWLNTLQHTHNTQYGWQPANGKKLMVEYSSPNTNKPLHLGHLRNNFLGWSVAELYKATGYEVVKTCIVNDRGVHICKSMLAWQKFGQGATPQSTNKKGDHLVGDYYVMFEQALKAETAPLLEKLRAGEAVAGLDAVAAEKLPLLQAKIHDAALAPEKRDEAQAALTEMARNATPLMAEVRQMLLKWEQGDAETIALWQTMNGWVYAGFDATYQRIGSNFDLVYYESETYLLGKQRVEEGLALGVFYKKADGSVWIDLSTDGFDEKLVLRKDGTSVYMTQDIGLAERKYADFAMDESIYVVGDEQNYHLSVLKLICQKLNMPFAGGIKHLSYGMVELPTGRMKSREGTVVDADDLCNEMEGVAAAKTLELGKVNDFEPHELAALYATLGMGALKFYLLRVDPKKRMIFNPEESIDFHGFTGPFVQYTYARIQSVLRKMDDRGANATAAHSSSLLPAEKAVLVLLEQFEGQIALAAAEMNPSILAGYVFLLAKTFNGLYAEHSIVGAESIEKQVLRLKICRLVATVLKNGMGLLGIGVPARM
ncbi:MAG: arginine--tRNA ligase [Bacteroidetes bacterium]|nr:MAG: arginine--tRNA ligase [Bacteroidota bacterium]